MWRERERERERERQAETVSLCVLYKTDLMCNQDGVY